MTQKGLEQLQRELRDVTKHLEQTTELLDEAYELLKLIHEWGCTKTAKKNWTMIDKDLEAFLEKLDA